jgi:hypothetical protein
MSCLILLLREESSNIAKKAREPGEMRMIGTSSILNVSIWALVVVGALTGWQPFNQIVMAQNTSSDDLKIVIIAGDGFTNNIKKRTAREEIVEVRDRNNKPVSGALVVFTLPGSGPSGTFAHGLQTLTVTSDNAGRAAASVKPNGVPGQFKTSVTASFGALTAAVSISQTNALLAGAASGGISGTTIGIGVAVAAGAAITAVTLVKVLGGGGKKARISIGPPTLP